MNRGETHESEIASKKLICTIICVLSPHKDTWLGRGAGLAFQSATATRYAKGYVQQCQGFDSRTSCWLGVARVAKSTVLQCPHKNVFFGQIPNQESNRQLEAPLLRFFSFGYCVMSRLYRFSEILSRIKYGNRGIWCGPRVVPVL